MSRPPEGAAENDGRGGIYTWNLGIQGGHCDRNYIAGAGGPGPAGVGSGGQLGGIVVSPVIGGRIGPRLDVSDQACATAALELAQPDATVSWTTAGGIPMTVQPTRDYKQSDGSACRDFAATARFASQAQTVRGSACRNNQTGGWEPIG
jgi:surface antigen